MKGNTDMAVLYQINQYKSKVVQGRHSRRHGEEKKIMGKRKRPWVGYKVETETRHHTRLKHELRVPRDRAWRVMPSDPGLVKLQPVHSVSGYSKYLEIILIPRLREEYPDFIN